MAERTRVMCGANLIEVRNTPRIALAFDRSIISVVDFVIFSWIPFVLLCLIDGKMAASLLFEHQTYLQVISGKCAVFYLFSLLAITPLPLMYMRVFFKFVVHSATPAESLVSGRIISSNKVTPWLFELKVALSQYCTLVLAVLMAITAIIFEVVIVEQGLNFLSSFGFAFHVIIFVTTFFLTLVASNMPLSKNKTRSFFDYIMILDLKMVPLVQSRSTIKNALPASQSAVLNRAEPLTDVE